MITYLILGIFATIGISSFSRYYFNTNKKEYVKLLEWNPFKPSYDICKEGWVYVD